MQINRLFEIVYILLNKKHTTAKELAERFEVSTRTIYRDVENLCEAGVPIYMSKGKGGGIRLLDNFVLNKSYLSSDEKKEIIAALQGMEAAPYMPQNEVLGKLSALFGEEQIEWINVDFGSWDGGEKEKFERIKEAILNNKSIEFEYYNANMEKVKRKVDPLQLCFKARDWYLKGYCHVRKQMRFFKLKRIRNLVCLEEEYHRLKIKEELERQITSTDFAVNGSRDKEAESASQTEQRQSWTYEPIKLWIEASQAYRVFDEFEETQVTKKEDGSFIVTINYPKDEWLYGYLLSYGPYAKVLEPIEIKEIIKERLKRVIEKYSLEE